MMGAFTLDDPRENAREAPYTYFLPPAGHLAAIQPGDLVKLVFRPTTPDTKWGAERMWVSVRTAAGDALTGALDNHPDDIPGLKAGDPIEFSRWHVIAIDFPASRTVVPLPDGRRNYWERCMVDQAVLDGELLVDY